MPPRDEQTCTETRLTSNFELPVRSVIIELFGVPMTQAGGELSSVAQRSGSRVLRFSGSVNQIFYVRSVCVLAPSVTTTALKDIDEPEQRKPRM